MKILLATDFSSTAASAADLAVALARRFGDSVALVHVLEPPSMAYPDLMVDVSTLERALLDRATALLREAADAIRARGIVVEERLTEGNPSERISELAREIGARLVVVGTHGRGALSRAFLGSVAERTVLSADRPVLVVRPTESATEVDAWASGRRPLRVTVAVDVSAPSAAAVGWVRRLREVVACDVTFVHLYWPPAEYARLGLVGPRSLSEADPTVARVIERELASIIGELPGQGRVAIKIQPAWGELGSHLGAEASATDADLLVIGTHRRHGLKRLWLGATTQPTLHAAPVPVLCVPSTEAEVRPVTNAIPELRQVLVTTDFSPLANRAIPFAYALVREGGVVHLCHVAEHALPNPLYAYPDDGAVTGKPLERELRSKLDALVPPEALRRGIQTHAFVADGGRAATAILQAAERLGVDAICLASHGRSGLAEAILGSVAHEVVGASERPVLIVRAPRG
jgi:nucleotide-binding universal stress UspA family protein